MTTIVPTAETPAHINPSTLARLREVLRQMHAEQDAEPWSPEMVDDLIRQVGRRESAPVELQVQNEALRRTQQELEASRRELFDLYESAPVAYVFLSPQGIVHKANAMGRRLLGTDPVGRGFSSFLVPEDWGPWFRQMGQADQGKIALHLDLRLANAAAPPTIVEIRGQACVGAGGGLEGWQLTFSDVTRHRLRDQQLKRLHEQLDVAARAAGLGVWSLDPRSGDVTANDRFFHQLGRAPAKGPMDGELFFTSIHPDDRRGRLCHLKAFLASTDDDIDEEYRIVRKDGTVRWLATRGRIYRDGEGRPESIGGVNTDITARKEQEARQQQLRRQLTDQLQETRRLNEELSQYAYAASHDLKAPMRAIRNYADFLSEDLAQTLSGEQRQYIDGLKQAVEQGHALIDDLLAFSRLEKAAIHKENVDLSDLVSQIRAMLDPKSAVEFRLDAILPTIVSDRTLIRQILQNLLSNAVKFNRRTPKRVTMGWRAASEGRIDIYVRDNGIGIASAHHQKIFGIFQRLHPQSQFDGTGIGLAIVRKAARLLGGTVRLESEPDVGSTFTVRLPLQLSGDATRSPGGLTAAESPR